MWKSSLQLTKFTCNYKLVWPLRAEKGLFTPQDTPLSTVAQSSFLSFKSRKKKHQKRQHHSKMWMAKFGKHTGVKITQRDSVSLIFCDRLASNNFYLWEAKLPSKTLAKEQGGEKFCLSVLFHSLCAAIFFLLSYGRSFLWLSACAFQKWSCSCCSCSMRCKLRTCFKTDASAPSLWCALQ